MAKLLELEIAFDEARQNPRPETMAAYQQAIYEAAREYPLAKVKEFISELEQKAEDSPWVLNPA